jgi:hypothetical protein
MRWGSPGGRQQFTDKERGTDKYRYYRRDVFWMKVGEMVMRMGHTAERACDKIYYQAYGAS